MHVVLTSKINIISIGVIMNKINTKRVFIEVTLFKIYGNNNSEAEFLRNQNEK